MSVIRPSATVSPTGPHPLAIGTAWIVATVFGLGAGTWLLSVAKPEEEWIGPCFVTAMFLAQYVALALLGRHRPLLPVVGAVCSLAAGFAALWLRERGASVLVIRLALAAIFSAPWALTLSVRWGQVVGWLVVGVLSTTGGFLAADAVFERVSAASPGSGRLQALATLYACVAGGTALMAVWFCRAVPPSARPSGTVAPGRAGRVRASAGSLRFGRIVLVLAGLYAVALGAAVLAGDHALWQASDPELGELARWDRPHRPHNALDLGAFGPASGILCLVVGAGLLARQGWARHALHVAAPCGALALAGTYPQRLWTQDIPKTVLLGLVFGGLALLVSRRGAIAAATWRRDGTSATGTWVRRCVPIALGMLGLAFGAYLYVKSSKPRPFGMRVSMNEYVQVLVVTHLFLWHAVPGLIGAAVPFLRRGAGSSPAA